MEMLSISWWSSSWSARCGAPEPPDLVCGGRSKKLGPIEEDRSAFHSCWLLALGYQPVEINRKQISCRWNQKQLKGQSIDKRLTISSGTLLSGSIMPWYVWADVLNRCSFHSSHHCLYSWVIKRAGTHADRSMSVVSAFGWSWAILNHSSPLVIISLGFTTSA